MTSPFYRLKAVDNKNKEIDFSIFQGKIVLIVNTASKCGFTPQYKGLEELYTSFSSQGLVVLGFPCDQFGNQEPGTNEEIATFCQVNFGVTFPLMAKIDVNGPNASAVFTWAKKASSGLFQKFLGTEIKWNFTKFLVSADGNKVQRFAPSTSPAQLRLNITKLM